jgi:hypothetical protein
VAAMDVHSADLDMDVGPALQPALSKPKTDIARCWSCCVVVGAVPC